MITVHSVGELVMKKHGGSTLLTAEKQESVAELPFVENCEQFSR